MGETENSKFYDFWILGPSDPLSMDFNSPNHFVKATKIWKRFKQYDFLKVGCHKNPDG